MGGDLTNVPWRDTQKHLERLDPSIGLHTNVFYCWPSVGGIIVAERAHPVKIPRTGIGGFHRTPRSSDSTEEDAFCTKLRMIGDKWWSGWRDYQQAIKPKMRTMLDEWEVLFWDSLRKNASVERRSVPGNAEDSNFVDHFLRGLDSIERRDPELEDGGWWDYGYELRQDSTFPSNFDSVGFPS
ncbi:hypothetical protein VTL71DRAFT_16324 [Oculimacula yallundae]|uniref:Uncharacterized protein n=1 Tax=Oculimacula yallundae TaxID=86028 RepID=A0ABR4CFF9_9HELO